MLHLDRDKWTIQSRTGKEYVISIHVPDGTPPAEGYGVLYVLDGDAYFQLVKEIIRLQSIRAAKTGVADLVIVGIGYGVKDFHPRRLFDFTTSPNGDGSPLKPNSPGWTETGGADEFMAFVEEELKPMIHKQWPVNPQQQTLFGHSLGGLYTLYTMMKCPSAYQAYFACSPSIWWNNEALLEDVPDFIKQYKQNSESIKLFLAAGGEEKGHLVTAVRKYYERIKGIELLHVSYKEVEGENHASIIPTVLSTGLRFLG